jgi:hypothetical protein
VVTAPEAQPEPEFETGLADAAVAAAQAVVSGGTELAGRGAGPRHSDDRFVVALLSV